MTLMPRSNEPTSRQVRFRRGVVLFAATLVGLVGLEGVIFLATGKRPWWTPVGASALGVFAALWAFVGGLGFLRRLLRLEWAPLAVARVVLEEAIRRRIAVTCASILLITILVLPFTLDDPRLDYRLQSFLSYSVGLTGLLLSIITIFLACGTISTEIEDRRIHTVLVKPIRRGAYLLGKLLGVLLLNALLLTVAGTAIYAFSHLQVVLETEGDTGHQADTAELKRVHEQVLIARRSVTPEPEKGDLERRALRQFKRLSPKEVEALGGESEALTIIEEIETHFRPSLPILSGRHFVFAIVSPFSGVRPVPL